MGGSFLPSPLPCPFRRRLPLLEPYMKHTGTRHGNHDGTIPFCLAGCSSVLGTALPCLLPLHLAFPHACHLLAFSCSLLPVPHASFLFWFLFFYLFSLCPSCGTTRRRAASPSTRTPSLFWPVASLTTCHCPTHTLFICHPTTPPPCLLLQHPSLLPVGSWFVCMCLCTVSRTWT